jgi:hypothetical protein
MGGEEACGADAESETGCSGAEGEESALRSGDGDSCEEGCHCLS